MIKTFCSKIVNTAIFLYYHPSKPHECVRLADATEWRVQPQNINVEGAIEDDISFTKKNNGLHSYAQTSFSSNDSSIVFLFTSTLRKETAALLSMRLLAVDTS